MIKRTMVNNEVRNVAKFLARLVRRNDRKQTGIVKALDALARGGRGLKVFDQWLEVPNELVRCAAKAVRTYETKSYVVQATNCCTGKRSRVRGKTKELLFQRRDLIECLIW